MHMMQQTVMAFLAIGCLAVGVARTFSYLMSSLETVEAQVMSFDNLVALRLRLSLEFTTSVEWVYLTTTYTDF